jgi:hypothetical protein
MAYTIAAAAPSPGMIDSSTAVRTPTRATSPSASSGPPIAPRVTLLHPEDAVFEAIPTSSRGTMLCPEAL